MISASSQLPMTVVIVINCLVILFVKLTWLNLFCKVYFSHLRSLLCTGYIFLCFYLSPYLPKCHFCIVISHANQRWCLNPLANCFHIYLDMCIGGCCQFREFNCLLHIQPGISLKVTSPIVDKKAQPCGGRHTIFQTDRQVGFHF